MIVRISTEGQYRISAKVLDKLNKLDDHLVTIVATNNKAEFHRLFADIIELVRREGQAVPVEELVPSDVVLPPPDTELHEARRLIKADGLIPG